MKNISCAFIASFYGPYYSNFVASMIAFEKEMQKLNNKVIYIFPQEVEKFEWIKLLNKENKSIYFLPYKPYSLSNILAIRKIFKQENINLIYSHMCGWDFTAHFAAPFTPIIWHMRMGVNNKGFSHKLKNFIKFKIIGFSKVNHIASSDAVCEQINYYRPKYKCVSVPNAIDFDRLNVDCKVKRNNDVYTLLVFGWSPIVKGLDTVLDACEILNRDNIKVKLIVSAQEKTYPYISERYQYKPDYINLVPPTDNVSELFSSVDCMVSASRSEGFSNSLAEAIYFGLPIVYSDIPGTSWASEFEATHKFITGQADSLVDAINKAIEQRITLDNQKYNKKKMQEKYSMDSWVHKVMTVINNIKI